MSNARFLITVVILIVVLALSVPLYMSVPVPKDEPQVSRLPMQIGDWTGRDLPIDEQAYKILETKNLVLREYTRGADKVFVYIIYSVDNRKVSHPPEVCFEGGGITITDKAKFSLELADGRRVNANRLEVEKARLVNIVYYLYKAGSYYTDNYLNQQLHIALARLSFRNLSGAMLRVSAEVKPEEGERAEQNLREFFKAASAHFPAIIP